MKCQFWIMCHEDCSLNPRGANHRSTHHSSSSSQSFWFIFSSQLQPLPWNWSAHHFYTACHYRQKLDRTFCPVTPSNTSPLLFLTSCLIRDRSGHSTKSKCRRWTFETCAVRYPERLLSAQAAQCVETAAASVRYAELYVLYVVRAFPSCFVAVLIKKRNGDGRRTDKKCGERRARRRHQRRGHRAEQGEEGLRGRLRGQVLAVRPLWPA